MQNLMPRAVFAVLNVRLRAVFEVLNLRPRAAFAILNLRPRAVLAIESVRSRAVFAIFRTHVTRHHISRFECVYIPIVFLYPSLDGNISVRSHLPAENGGDFSVNACYDPIIKMSQCNENKRSRMTLRHSKSERSCVTLWCCKKIGIATIKDHVRHCISAKCKD